MTKTKNKQKRVKATAVIVRSKKKSGGMRSGAAMRYGLDQAAVEYARLLKDPCNAPLAHSLGIGTGGSIVSRFENDFIAYGGATEVCGIYAFTPGLFQNLTNIATLTADTQATTLAIGNLVPGIAFLQATAGSARCVAACLQVSFPGTELNRSGIVGLGVVSTGALQDNLQTSQGGLGVNTTTAQMRTLCQHTERMPQSMAEITWFPGSMDLTSSDTNNAANVLQSNITPFEGRNSLLLSASGFPVNTGIRIRVVAVYEWTPRANQGIVNTSEPSRSRNKADDVLRVLHQQDPAWYVNAYKKVGHAIDTVGSIINYGSKILGAFV